MNVSRILTISVAFYNNFFNLGDFYKINFFSKKPYILFIIAKFWTFCEVLLFQSRFTTGLLRSAIFFGKNQFFFQKTHHIFPSKKLNFERFEKFYYFSRILQQFCYTYCFFFSRTVFFKQPIYLAKFRDMEKIKEFFEKPMYLSQRKTQILNIYRKPTNSVAFNSKFCAFSGFWKPQSFFSE